MSISVATPGAASGWFQLDFFSEVKLQAGVNHVAGDINLLDIIVTLPTGITIQKVYGLLSCPFITNSNASANIVSGDQSIRVMKDGGTWDVDDLDYWTFASGLENFRFNHPVQNEVLQPQLLIGNLDLKSEVDAGAPTTYHTQWEDAHVSGLSMYFDGLQTGLRIFYTP